MARDVGERLLHQPIEHESAGFVQRLEIARHRQLDRHKGKPRSPLIDAMLERCGNSQLVETHGPQLPDKPGHHTIDTVDIGDHCAERLMCARVSGRCFAYRHRIELDGIEILAQFIVQVARQRLALGFLDVDVLLGQSLVFGKRFRELRLCRPAVVQLPGGLNVTTGGEPDEADRDHQQDRRQFIELQALVGTGPLEQCLA